jgi:hypothetical protein
MYEKGFPRELVDIVADNPCIPVDGYSFIWTSTMFLYCRYKMKEEQGRRRPNKIEVEDERMIKEKMEKRPVY